MSDDANPVSIQFGGVSVSAAHPFPVTSSGGGTSDVNLTQVGGAAIALGQAVMASSLPVTVASNQSTLPVISATADVLVGAVNETAPASDTASSGLNGRLQRVAQRITSLIAQIPATLGIKSPALSMSTTSSGYQYETVAAAQTAQVLGATGATGDYLSHLVFQPAATNAGTTTVLDNATVIYTFTSGTLADLKPFTVPIGCFSVSGAWKVTTGSSIAVIGVGNFT